MKVLCSAVLTMTTTLTSFGQATTQASWSSLPDLPISAGISGAFIAAMGPDLFVGGGSAFPDAPPWRGGTKKYYDQCFMLRNALTPAAKWEPLAETLASLPAASGYGVTIATDNSLFLIGGCDNEKCYSNVYEITWDASKLPRLMGWPALPVPLAYATGALVGDKIFIAGGQSHPGGPALNTFFCLDLSRRSSPDWKWQELPAWPGSPRAVAVSCAVRNQFYLFSGRNVLRGLPSETLNDAFCFDATTSQWRQLRDLPNCIMGGSAIMDEAGRVLLYGGDDGELFLKLETQRKQIADAASADKVKLNDQLNEMLEHHPGFNHSVLRFDPKRNDYEVVGQMPPQAAVTTTAVRMGNRVIMPVGEVRPGIRSPKVWATDVPR